MAKRKIRRKDVVIYAEVNERDYGKCGTCRHYQDLMTCGECYNLSRYSFDWKYCLKENEKEIEEYLEIEEMLEKELEEE